MDDIRRPYRGERRDYAIPAGRRPAPNVTDLRAAPPQPSRHAPQPQPAPPHHHQPPAHHAQPYHHAPAVQAAPHARKKQKLSLSLPIIAAVLLAAVAVAGGFYLLKPKAKPAITPTQLATKSSFSFYYPIPLPNGYAYNQEISAFQGGQAYYMLANGKKHLVIHEQASISKTLDLSSLTKPTTINSSSGLAAVGTTAGEASGVVLANATLITINSTGSVPQDDIIAIINSLRVLPH